MNKTQRNIFANYRFSMTLAILLFLVLLVFLHQHINIFFALVNVAFIFSVLLLISKVKNRVVRLFLAGIVFIILSVSLTFAVLFSAPLGLGNIASIFETNQAEIAATPSKIYLFFGFCLLTTTLLGIKAINEMKRLFSLGRSALIFVGIVIFINLSAILIPVWRNSSFFSGYQKDLRELPLQTIYAFSSLRSPLLYGDILGLAVYSHEKFDFWRYKDMAKIEPSGVILDEMKNPVPTIYLVVGESAYRDRMSLYGYEKPNTPFLDSLFQLGHIEYPLNYYVHFSSPLHYRDGISVANTTRDAIRYSLSFASPRSPHLFWRMKNVVEVAKDAGYHTSWLSNQGQAGLYDNYPSYIARSSDSVYFETKLKKDDLDLLPLLDNYYREEAKQFMVMHLMGSHFPFSERSDEKDNNLQDDYDRSIHHTDRFLRQLYHYAKEKNGDFMIVYYSDHGASPERGIHGLKNADVSEYKIPLLIIDETAHRISVSDLLDRYTDEKTNTINNLSMAYILCELMAYSVDYWSVSSIVEQGESVMLVDGSLVEFSSFHSSDDEKMQPK